MNQDEFTKAFITAFKNERVLDKLRTLISSELQKELKKELDEPKDPIAEKDNKIKVLEKKVDALENRNDDLEQYSRRNSLRQHGVDEEDDEDILHTTLPQQ